jgi:[acyl-carrier-protein] S-malonyltransferase
VVVPANINAPGQIVISGELKAVENAINTAKEIGARRALALSVSGAFHSSLMSPARQPLLEIMNSITFNDASIPIFQNVSAAPFTDSTTIKNNIIDQLEKPVLWCDTILNLKNMGITDFYEVGPGNVLKGLNRRIFPESNTFTCDKLENLKTCEVL